MTAEISYDGQILCQINQDHSKEDMEIEFFHEQYILARQPKMKFLISEFFSLIEEVKKDLAAYRE